MDTPTAGPLRVAVIGAGPSGFYAAESLLKARDDVSIDLVDRLPTPFGLVRYGVAPDHQKLKSVTKLYERTAQDPRVRFLGNVEFGRDLTADEVRAHYHAVVFAYGAPGDRRLGIPGEDLEGSLSATEFVAWYNGHPDYTDLDPPLDVETAVVVGVGNVAVDVTRILAKTVEELADSDIADHALAALARSTVRDVVVLGRRGPAEAKFTTKELRELGELPHADIVIDPRDLEVIPESLAAIAGDAIAKKNLEVMREFAARPPGHKRRRIVLRFFASPVELIADESARRVAGVTVERNRLAVRPDGSLSAVGTGELEHLSAQLVLRSVGYRGARLPGVPFDEREGVIPNVAGRVLDESGGSPVPGCYVVGWIKRGPSGLIGSNKADAMETVATLLADDLPEPVDPRPEAVDELLATRGVAVVDYACWSRIDRAELAAGVQSGRVRVKIVSRADLLAAAREDEAVAAPAVLADSTSTR
jgi:ferredoxin/flavodoxin---NADP+ reductase